MKESDTKKRKKAGILILGISVVVVLAVMLIAAYKVFLAVYGDRERDTHNVSIDYSEYDVLKPDIKQMLLTKNDNSRPGIALSNVNGIVIHYTANPGTDAKANRDYFESRKNEPDKNSNKVSSHFIIGLDGTIVQCIPLNEISYASNNRNADTISIECCHPNATGKFSNATYQSLIKLSAWLCSKYHLSKAAIIRHYDITGKMCPLYYVKHKEAWASLKADIWQYMSAVKG